MDDLRPGDFRDIDTLVLRFWHRAGAVMTALVEELRRIGLCWHPSGQAGLRGPLLALADRCDRAFMSLAAIWDASKERHPASLPAAWLQRVDYLRSFPHQASLSARLDPAGLTDFLSGEVLGEHGEVAVTRLSPIREVLDAGRLLSPVQQPGGRVARPAALPDHAQHLLSPRIPLRAPAAVVELLHAGDRLPGHEGRNRRVRAAGPEAADEFLRLMDLPVERPTATDPFFQPQSSILSTCSSGYSRSSTRPPTAVTWPSPC